jgi:uncharacterized membrane protein YvbJ
MSCNKCGTENDESSKFCSKCGQNLLLKLACGKCGTLLKSNAIYCAECGEKFEYQSTSDKSSLNRNNADVETKNENKETPLWAWLIFIVFTLIMISLTGLPGLIVGPIAYYYYVARHQKK